MKLSTVEIALWRVDIAERFRSARRNEGMTAADQDVYLMPNDRSIYPRLASEGLIEWIPSGGYCLTDNGRRVVAAAQKRHRP